MTMIEIYWYEFSKIYARLMRLEIQIKRSALYAIKNYYGENSLKVFQKFFQNAKRRNRYSINNFCKFDGILNRNDLDPNEKLEKLLNILYLSDLLNLILKTKQFKITQISNDFYYKIPDNYKILEDCIRDLTDLRNCIAHYKFQTYAQHKNSYLDSLLTFEIYMGHNIANILELPKLENVSTMEILTAIYDFRPDLILETTNSEDALYFNKHRLLLTLFDDIAIYNGVSASELPTPWSVLRGMYKLKAKIKQKLNN